MRKDDQRHRKTTNYLDSPYLAALRKLATTPGTVQCVEILHDDWCDVLNGRGHCNCNPVIGKPEVSNKGPKGRP